MNNKRKTAFIVLSVLLVVACIAVASLAYHDHTTSVAAKQTSAVQKAQATLKLHDQVNAANLQNATSRIDDLSKQKVALCNQLKAAKLVQPLCQQ